MTERTASLRRMKRRPSTSSRHVWPQSMPFSLPRAPGRVSVQIRAAEQQKVTASTHRASDSWFTLRTWRALKWPSQEARPASEAKAAEPRGNVP